MKADKALRWAIPGTVLITAAMIALTFLTFNPEVKNNPVEDTAVWVFFIWLLVVLNMLVSKTVKQKNRTDGRTIVIISIVLVVIVGMAIPAFITFRVIPVAQPWNDMLAFAIAGLFSLIVPALVLRLPYHLQYGGKIWKCPNCGTLLQKPDNDTWKYVGSANVVGMATCASCGAGSPIAEVYSGRYDV